MLVLKLDKHPRDNELTFLSDVIDSLYDWQAPFALVEKTVILGDGLGRHALLREGTAYREAY